MWYALATAQDRNPDRVYRMCLLTLDGDAFRDARVLGDGESPVHEKNWAPLVANDTLSLVYSASPTIVLRCDPESGAVGEQARQEAPAIARSWRGGSQAIPFGDGFLMLVHEAIPFDVPWRAYRHRWVLLDAKHRISQCTPQFVFLYRGVEFAAGLARRGDELIASFGVNDREAYLAVTKSDEVRRLLQPIGAIADSSPILEVAAGLEEA
jgi:hypothetical protein